jgi:hypothetical protein
MFTAALFTMAKIWNQSRYPTIYDWIKKNVVNINNRVLFSHKKRMKLCDFQENR